VSKIEAIDASPSMVERYNARIAELGPAHKSTRAVVGNLLSNPASPCTLEGNRYHGFDLITVGAALHHFANAATAVERLAERLRAGGIVYIQDMFDDGHVGSESDRPRGFTFDELRSVMSSAGLVDFRFEVLPDAFEMELPNAGVVKIRCFIARATKRKQ
jgi:SAM-dependent methyltransferase